MTPLRAQMPPTGVTGALDKQRPPDRLRRAPTKLPPRAYRVTRLAMQSATRPDLNYDTSSSVLWLCQQFGQFQIEFRDLEGANVDAAQRTGACPVESLGTPWIDRPGRLGAISGPLG